MFYLKTNGLHYKSALKCKLPFFLECLTVLHNNYFAMLCVVKWYVHVYTVQYTWIILLLPPFPLSYSCTLYITSGTILNHREQFQRIYITLETGRDKETCWLVLNCQQPQPCTIVKNHVSSFFYNLVVQYYCQWYYPA